MKMSKIYQNSFFALAIVLLCGFTQKAKAQQYNLIPATVDLTSAEYQALDVYGMIPVLQSGPNYFVGHGTGTGTIPPPHDCPEHMTPELRTYMQDLANSTCEEQVICVLGSNCAYWLYIFEPNTINCYWIGLPPYHSPLTGGNVFHL